MFARLLYYLHSSKPTLRRSLSSSVRLRMPSNNPTMANASGLTPAETKALKERQAEPHESQIIASIKEVSQTAHKEAYCDATDSHGRNSCTLANQRR